MKSVLQNLTKACLYALLFIPLIVASPLFFPFITGKNFVFRVLVAIALASWSVLMLRYSEFRPKKSLVLWSLGVFTVLIGISDMFAINSIKAFWSNFERMEGYITILYLFALFIVSSSIFKNLKDWTRFFNVSFVAAWMIGFYGVFQLLGKAEINQGGVRVDATLGNATYLAVYMLFHVFIALFLFLRARSEKKNGLMWLYGVGAVFFTFMMIETATRGALLGLIGGLGLSALLIAIFERKDRTLRKLSFGLIGIGVFVILGFIAIKNTPVIANSPIFSRFASISLSEGNSRFMVWGMALEGVKEKPIFGWGQENFVYVFNKYYDPGMYAQEQWFDRTHNVFFDWAIAGGILGLLAYLSLFVSVVWLVWKAEGLLIAERAVVTGMLFGYFINNLFVFDNITSYLLFISVAAMVHALGGKKIHKISLVETEVSDMTLSRLALPAAILCCFVILYFSVWQGIKTSSQLINGLKYVGGYGVPKDIAKAIDSFKLATSYGALGRTETRERIVESVQGVNSSSADIPTKQAFLDFAKAELLAELEQTKDDARIEFFTSIFFANYGLFDDALLHAKRAVELSPTKQTLLYHNASLLLKKGLIDEALVLFKRAYEEKPENEEALKYYALGAIYKGDTKLVESLLIPKYGTVLIPEDRFAGAYMDTKQWGLAAKLWEARIKENAGDPRYFYQLAVVYSELGNISGAVSALQKIEKIDPKLKDQVDAFIEQVRSGKKLQ